MDVEHFLIRDCRRKRSFFRRFLDRVSGMGAADREERRLRNEIETLRHEGIRAQLDNDQRYRLDENGNIRSQARAPKHCISATRLMKGDCLALLKGLPDQSIDAVICDLPYGTTLAPWDIPLDLDELWRQYSRICKPSAPIVLFAAQPFTSKLIASQMPFYRHVWYWLKEKGTNHFRTGRQPLRVVEDICVFSNAGGWTYNPQMVPLDKPYRHTMPKRKSALNGGGDLLEADAPREYKVYTHAHPTNLLTFPRDKALVPTQKPIALLEYIVKTYTHEGDTVLDNTMGSGTTGVACKRLGRHFVGMEMDPDHFQIAKARIDAT